MATQVGVRQQSLSINFWGYLGVTSKKNKQYIQRHCPNKREGGQPHLKKMSMVSLDKIVDLSQHFFFWSIQNFLTERVLVSNLFLRKYSLNTFTQISTLTRHYYNCSNKNCPINHDIWLGQEMDTMRLSPSSASTSTSTKQKLRQLYSSIIIQPPTQPPTP